MPWNDPSKEPGYQAPGSDPSGSGSNSGWGGYGRGGMTGGGQWGGYQSQPPATQWGGTQSSNGYGKQPVGQQNGANFWNQPQGGYQPQPSYGYQQGGGQWNGYSGGYQPQGYQGYGQPTNSGAPTRPWYGGGGDNYNDPSAPPMQGGYNPGYRRGGGDDGWGGYGGRHGRRHGEGGPGPQNPIDPVLPQAPAAQTPEQLQKAVEDARTKYAASGSIQNADGTYGNAADTKAYQDAMAAQQRASNPDYDKTIANSTAIGKDTDKWDSGDIHSGNMPSLVNAAMKILGPGGSHTSASGLRVALMNGATPAEAAQYAQKYAGMHGGDFANNVQGHNQGEDSGYGWMGIGYAGQPGYTGGHQSSHAFGNDWSGLDYSKKGDDPNAYLDSNGTRGTGANGYDAHAIAMNSPGFNAAQWSKDSSGKWIHAGASAVAPTGGDAGNPTGGQTRCSDGTMVPAGHPCPSAS